ncbi:MAG: ATP-dependent 6-phosphofructokinase [Chloroflexi bacterium]|jgi:6-phosphofructokinase 1|nr:ATP-dependent 6-phosphofructokinase [Chloroflexota bacterium]
MKIGLLTAGSDSPGVNAAIRGFGKASSNLHNIELIGFRDGFEGLIQNRSVDLLKDGRLSGILTLGGTILGTSKYLPDAVVVGNETADQSQQAIDSYHQNQLDALVCIGDKSTQLAAHKLSQAGLNIVTLPKSVENDIPHTDKCIGFDSAREIATQAIDRLHTNASATHRIMIVELLGNSSGWLTLGAGLAAGADVILIPEVPYFFDYIIEAIQSRQTAGRNFSLVAVAERARSKELMDFMEMAARKKAASVEEKEKTIEKIENNYSAQTLLLANRLAAATNIETHITILGSLVRGGTPTAADRLLATQLAEWSLKLVLDGNFGTMACRQDGAMSSIALEEVAGKNKAIPLDHGWLRGAIQVDTCLGVSSEIIDKG